MQKYRICRKIFMEPSKSLIEYVNGIHSLVNQLTAISHLIKQVEKKRVVLGFLPLIFYLFPSYQIYPRNIRSSTGRTHCGVIFHEEGS